MGSPSTLLFYKIRVRVRVTPLPNDQLVVGKWGLFCTTTGFPGLTSGGEGFPAIPLPDKQLVVRKGGTFAATAKPRVPSGGTKQFVNEMKRTGIVIFHHKPLC